MNAILPTPRLLSLLLLKGDEMNAMLVKLAFEENHAPACTFRVCDGVGALEFLRGAPHFADVPRPDLSGVYENLPVCARHIDGKPSS